MALSADDIQYKLVKGQEISHYTNEVAALRIEIFFDFPYLYQGDLDYEKKYLQVYVNSPRSLLILALANNVIIGASTALPLSDEADYVIEPFLKNGFDPLTVFYFGESVLKKQYRGKGIGKAFFNYREQHAVSFGQYRKTCFCAVNREPTHPLRPQDYKPLDSFWTGLGYNKENKITSQFSWRDIGDDVETKKSMTYWLKDL